MIHFYRGIIFSSIGCVSQLSFADGLDTYNFFEHFQQENSSINATADKENTYSFEHDLNMPTYFGEDQPEEAPSIISHNLYETERLRFYNQTRYDISNVKDKYQQEGLAHISLSDISFSLGYGMEYKFTAEHSIGYEYLSSFPSNNTQSIRLFWKRTF